MQLVLGFDARKGLEYLAVDRFTGFLDAPTEESSLVAVAQRDRFMGAG